MIRVFISVLVLISVLIARSEIKEDFDIYLMIGQSNMAGRGELEEKDTTETIEGVYLLDSNEQLVEAKAPFNKYSTIRKELSLQGYSPANKFSELMHSRRGRKVLIVSNARGGSSIDHWMPGDKHEFLNEAIRRTRQAMNYGKLKGIAWHQGETNIQNGIAGYVEKFQTMITALRDSLGQKDLPVVIGQVGQWRWAPAEDIRAFNDSIVPLIAEKVSNCKYVVSDDLSRRYKDKEKDPHFGRKAQMELGRRYADAMTELVDSVFVTKFKDGKKGCVSFTFDDGDLDHYILVAPELEKHGFKGTFWIIGKKINDGDSIRPRMNWSQLKELSLRGHEISNHSFTHGKLALMSPAQARREIEMNDSAIERNIGIKSITFCYPFNSDPDWLVRIAEENRIGTRRYQTGVGQQNNKSTPETLQAWTDDVIEKGKWGVTMTHGITTGYDKWSNPQDLWDFFGYVKSREEDLWVAPFCDVAEYFMLRDNINIDVKTTNNTVIVTTNSLLDSMLPKSPVTVAIRGNWIGKNVNIERNGEVISKAVKDDLLLIEMLPEDQVEIRLLQ